MAIGLVGATLGVGGGFMLVPILFTILGWPLHNAVASSLFCTMTVSIAATQRYLGEGLPNVSLGISMEAAAMLGAIAGATVMYAIPYKWLGILFASITMVAAFRMWRPEQAFDKDRVVSPTIGRRLLAAPLFAIVGAVAAVLGLGGGVLKVPLLSGVLGLPTRKAVATSAFMIGITSGSAAAVYFSRGDVSMNATVLLALGVLPGALLGARVQHRWPVTGLRRTFAVVLVIFTIRVVLRLFQ